MSIPGAGCRQHHALRMRAVSVQKIHGNLCGCPGKSCSRPRWNVMPDRADYTITLGQIRSKQRSLHSLAGRIATLPGLQPLETRSDESYVAKTRAHADTGRRRSARVDQSIVGLFISAIQDRQQFISDRQTVVSLPQFSRRGKLLQLPQASRRSPLGNPRLDKQFLRNGARLIQRSGSRPVVARRGSFFGHPANRVSLHPNTFNTSSP